MNNLTRFDVDEGFGDDAGDNDDHDGGGGIDELMRLFH